MSKTIIRQLLDSDWPVNLFVPLLTTFLDMIPLLDSTHVDLLQVIYEDFLIVFVRIIMCF